MLMRKKCTYLNQVQVNFGRAHAARKIEGHCVGYLFVIKSIKEENKRTPKDEGTPETWEHTPAAIPNDAVIVTC